MTKYTGPSIPYKGSHVHSVAALLGCENCVDFTPRSYDIGASVPPIPHYEVGASVPPIPHFEVGSRSSTDLLKIPGHTRSWPGFPEYEVDVQAHRRAYPDVHGSVPSVPHYEVGSRSSMELLKIPGHTRSWPGFPEYEVDVQAHTRAFPDVHGSIEEVGRLEIGAASRAFDANPPRLTGKIRTFVKNGNLVAMSKILLPSTGGSMIIAIKIPMSTIRKVDPTASTSTVSGEFHINDSSVELGWSWKKLVKKAFKKTIRNPAFKLLAKKSAFAAKYAKKKSKYVAKKAYRVAKNPYVQKFAQTAAVAAAQAYGIPAPVTMAATDTLFSAMNGDAPSLDKIAVIAEKAAEGNPTAKKLKGLMALLYKGGMKDMNPYLMQAQQAAQNRLALTTEQLKIEASKRLPQGLALPGKPAGMFPFEIPGFSYGPSISGWLYNIPYRSNLSAKSIDSTNPFHILRGAYAQGMA